MYVNILLSLYSCTQNILFKVQSELYSHILQGMDNFVNHYSLVLVFQSGEDIKNRKAIFFFNCYMFHLGVLIITFMPI